LSFGFLEILFIAVALGCDAFAVGMGVGIRFCAPRQVFRLSFHFGLFQFLMPLIGWFLGTQFIGPFQRWGPWIACALLLFLGGKMLYESLRSGEREAVRSDPTRGVSLIMLSLATSIDALGVGFSLGVLGKSLFLPAVCIGVTAAAMTWVAMKLGNKISNLFGRGVEALGGVILILIGLKFLVT